MQPAAVLVLFALNWLLAAAVSAGEHDLRIVGDGEQKFLSWFGRTGRTYFVQVSQSSLRTESWTWLPIIRIGNDHEIRVELEQVTSSRFFRLQFVDAPAINPYLEDYDRDGLSNWMEVSESQTDPLNWDFDGDRIPDGWETQFALDPKNANDADLDPDRDGLTNREEYTHVTDPNNPDSDDDGITDGGEVDQNTDPIDPNDVPDAEWFILTGDLPKDALKSRKRNVVIPPGEGRVIVVLVTSDEYPHYTSGEGTDKDGKPFVFNDLLSWDIRTTGLPPLTGEIDVNARHANWEAAEENLLSAQGFSPVHVETGMSVTAPDDTPLPLEIELKATNVGDDTLPSTVLVGILPVIPMELFPELLDGDGNAIEGSTVPRVEPGQTNGMVEEDPVVNRIAHREIRMRIVDGDVLEGKILTWSMEPLFVPPGAEEAIFRGDWAHSTTHPNRYETAVEFGANGFEAIGQATARTEVDAGGDSAIRVNLAPIGFNKGRLRVAVEGFEGDSARLTDMEVPAVVVIDPGHGGPEGPRNDGSSWNNGISIGVDPPLSTDPRQQGESTEDYCARVGRALEKNLTLLWGRELKEQLSEEMERVGHERWRILLTRSTDVNPSIAERSHFARDNGADMLLSIHFNAFDDSAVHGPETWIETINEGNVNQSDDLEFANRIQGALDANVPDAYQSGQRGYRGVKQGTPSWVYRDFNLGNQDNRPPHTRACLAEIDFITNRGVEDSLVSGSSVDLNRSSVVESIAEAIVEDIEYQE